MKKIIFFLAAVFFVFSLTIFPAAPAFMETEDSNEASETENLEKISSPEQIKDFKIMKRIGNALFGTRKMALNQAQVASSSLEKITHPGLINQFDKIKKIGPALWGIRKRATSTPAISPEISACVAAAIDVKDKALMARVTAAAVELNTALSARSACQQAALASTSAQHQALNDCVKTFQAARKTIGEASRQVRKAAWDTYKVSLKNCRIATSSTAAVPMVEDGGDIFE